MPASLKFVLGLVGFAFTLALSAGFVEMRQDNIQSRGVAEAITQGSVAAGKLDIARFGCGSCHAIPGIAGANGTVAASLAEVAERAEVAGRLANTPPNMMRWLQNPQAVTPGTGMPNLGIDRKQARDIAAYLYTLRRVPRNP